ncbi:MAG: lysophospholipid acyltransferase family protein [Rhizobiaceae bacterium]
MRNFLFQAVYWLTSVVTALVAIPLLLVPGRKLLMRWLRIYAATMVYWMRVIAGIELEIHGRHHVPSGPSLIGAKHQSWGDGFCMFSQFNDLAFVTGDHLQRIPVVGWILRKMEAIVVDTCGGAQARENLVDRELSRARNEGRRMLIYPEGRLTPVGYYHRYRRGIYHMYEAYQAPVVPVATNLGLFWPLSQWDLKPGTAVIEFLEPIAPGLEKEAFMVELEKRIETASLALLPESFEIPIHRELDDEGEVIITELKQTG